MNINEIPMKIKLIAKNVYGNTMIYPDCQTSELFIQIARKKTLDKRDIDIVKKMGYQVTISGHIDNDLIKAYAA